MQVTEEIGKGKRYFYWRDNHGKIVNFAAPCTGSTANQVTFPYLLCMKGNRIMMTMASLLGWGEGNPNYNLLLLD
jgi:hypothetical protein